MIMIYESSAMILAKLTQNHTSENKKASYR